MFDVCTCTLELREGVLNVALAVNVQYIESFPTDTAARVVTGNSYLKMMSLLIMILKKHHG